MSDTSREKPRRYPGARAFGDTATGRRLFFGREDETEALLYQVLADDFVVLFGRSGHGKSSLVQAGLLQPLRDEGYFPVVIRLGDDGKGVASALCQAVLREAEEKGLENEPGLDASLWHFFSTLKISDGDAALTPVLILDQFEELFTVVEPDSRSAFVHELADLIRGTPPRNVDVDPDLDLPARRPKLKILISMRGDFLWELESLPRSIPQVFRSRFCVQALNRSSARLAIVKPAQEMGEWASRRFRWSDEAVEEVLDFLCAQGGGKDGQDQVEPFFLQLFCQAAEDFLMELDAAAEEISAARVIESGDIQARHGIEGDDGLDEILVDYYQKSLREVTSRPGSVAKSVRKLCERDLLSPSGHRLSLVEDQVLARVDREDLRRLLDTRLLGSFTRANGRHYELSHDSLVQPVVAVREREVRRRRRWGTRAATLVASLAVGWYAMGASDRRDDRFIEVASEILRESPEHHQLAAALLGEVRNPDVSEQWQPGVVEALHLLRSRPAYEGRTAPIANAGPVVSNGHLVVPAGNGVAVWDLGAPGDTAALLALGSDATVLRVASVGASNWVGLGFENGAVRAFRPPFLDSIVRITQHTGEKNAVRAVSFNADGTLVASSDEAGQIRLSRITGESVDSVLHSDSARVPGSAPGREGAYRLAFHPTDPHLLVSGTKYGFLELWDVSNDSLSRQAVLEEDPDEKVTLTSLAFDSVGGSLVVIRGGSPTVSSWVLGVDVEGRNFTDTVPLGVVGTASVSPNGSRLLTMNDSLVLVYSLPLPAGGAPRGDTVFHGGSGNAAWATMLDPGQPDGPPFLAATARGDGGVRLWRGGATEGELLSESVALTPAEGISFGRLLSSPGVDSSLVTASPSGAYGLWDLSAILKMFEVMPPTRQLSEGLTEPGANTVAAVSGGRLIFPSGPGVSFWDLSRPSTSASELDVSRFGDAQDLRVVEAGPSGWAGLGFHNGSALAVRPAVSRSAVSFATHDTPVRDIAFNADSTLVASSDQGGVITLAAITGPEIDSLASHVGSDGVYQLAFHPTDPHLLASATRGGGSEGSLVELWDVSSDTFLLSDTVRVGVRVDGLEFGSGGLVIVRRGTDSWYVPLDADSHQPMAPVALGTIDLATLSPTGSQLLTMTDGGEVRIYELPLGDERAVQQHEGNGDASWASIVPRAEGQRFFAATARMDGSIVLWEPDPARGSGFSSTTFPLQGPDAVGAVGVLQSSSRGQELATASADGSFRLWPLEDLPTTSATAPVDRSHEELNDMLDLLRARSCLTREDMAAALDAAVAPGGTEEDAHHFNLGMSRWFDPWWRNCEGE